MFGDGYRYHFRILIRAEKRASLIKEVGWLQFFELAAIKLLENRRNSLSCMNKICSSSPKFCVYLCLFKLFEFLEMVMLLSSVLIDELLDLRVGIT